MSAPIQRLTDSNSGGGSITNTDGNSTVFANNLLVSVDGSIGSGHGKRKHKPGAWATAGGSGSVFAHGVPVNYTGNGDTCGHARVGGSGNVFVGDTIDTDTRTNRAVNKLDEEDAVNPGPTINRGPRIRRDETPLLDEPLTTSTAQVLLQIEIQEGNISVEDLSLPAPAPLAVETTTSTVNTGTVLSVDCSDIASLTPFPTGVKIDSIRLTSRFTVAKLTRKPFVIFDNPLRGPEGGLSVEEIVCNLKLLAINVIEPILDQYPDGFVTNTWRPIGNGSATSQHPKGMACDIQFRKISKDQYFDIAKWCRDNILYDQLLLEYKSTGSGLPWIHVSFNKTSNRKQVLTFWNNRTYAQGLVNLGSRTA